MKQNVLLIVLSAVMLFSAVLGSVFLAKRNATADGELYRHSLDDRSGEEQLSFVDPSGASDNGGEQGGEEAEDRTGRVSFLAAGDIVLHESVFLDANRRSGQSGVSGSLNASSTYDFLPMYQNIRDAINESELSMVNQETLVDASVSGIPEGYPGFTGPKEAGDTLSELGFDVVNVANNHMLDQGSAGLRRSMNYWQTQDAVSMIGAYKNRSECDRFFIREINGVSVAILTYIGQTPATNGYSPDSSLYLPYLNRELVTSQMESARKAADCVIVTVHWGWEGTYSLNSEQKEYAKLFASLGADALIGTHPHVLQPMSWMERTEYEGGGRMLLCNSLGDFLSHTQLAGGKNALGNFLGGYVTFEIVKGEDGVMLENVRFTPTVSHYDKGEEMDYNFVIYPLEDYTNEQLAKFGDTKAGFTSVNQLYSIVKKNIPDEFLSDFYEDL